MSIGARPVSRLTALPAVTFQKTDEARVARVFSRPNRFLRRKHQSGDRPEYAYARQRIGTGLAPTADAEDHVR